MRSKEDANDYRYFPCPDLLPVELTQEYVDIIRNNLPELPTQKAERFMREYKLSEYDANVLSATRAMADYFEKVAEIAGNAKLAANWVMGELSKYLNTEGKDITESNVTSEQLGGLLVRIEDNTINGKTAKSVLQSMWEGEGSADQIIDAKGLKQVTDTGAIEEMIQGVLDANAAQVEQFRASDEDKQKKMIGFFMGQVMKASQGKANPGMVTPILNKLLKG